jgi:hypothetical protein
LAVIQVLDQMAGTASHGRSGGALSANSAGRRINISGVQVASAGLTSANRKSSLVQQRRGSSVDESFGNPVARIAGLATCRQCCGSAEQTVVRRPAMPKSTVSRTPDRQFRTGSKTARSVASAKLIEHYRSSWNIRQK